MKSIAARIGKVHQTVYREITRNSKPDGRYQPWFAHNQAYCAGADPRRIGSRATIGCVPSSPTSSPGTGCRIRSAGGCGDVAATARVACMR